MDTAESRLRIIQSSGRVNSVRKVTEEPVAVSSSKIRFFIAFTFFLAFYVLWQKDLTFMGITGEKIYETVCENAKGFDFVLDFPYTLDN